MPLRGLHEGHMTMGPRKLGRIPKHHKLVKRPRPGSGTADARRLAGIALIAPLLGLTACDRSPEVRAAPKPPSVTVVAAAQRSVPVYGQYVGAAEAVKTGVG